MAELAKQNNGVALQLNDAVGSVLNQTNLIGFERAYATATSIDKLQSLLTPEYMAPILKLQGNKLGFKTDKDKSGGYPIEVVKNCLIEAVLMGLQPYGNQFNIIAGNTYATKEGCGEILNKVPGLSYQIVTGIPQSQADGKSAVVECNIEWTLNGKDKKQTIPVVMKMDSYTTVDALKGKALRKARAWLIETVTGIEVGEGDVQDIPHEVVKTSVNVATEEKRKVIERIEDHIAKSRTLTDLEKCYPAIKNDDDDFIDVIALYDEKRRELTPSK